MNVLEFHSVHKRYYMAHALRGIDLAVARGKIVGLLGPNGAGKSTLLRIAAGLASPTSGSVRLMGRQLRPCDKRHIAYVPEVDNFYAWMTVRQAMEFESSMFGDMDVDDARSLLAELKLDPGKKVGALSRGQRAKLKLALAMSRAADLVLMDEPLAGIDPPSRAAILQTIASRYRAGEQAIIISTHEVLESEALFEDVVFLSSGRVVLSGHPDQLREERGQSLNEIFAEVC